MQSRKIIIPGCLYSQGGKNRYLAAYIFQETFFFYLGCLTNREKRIKPIINHKLSLIYKEAHHFLLHNTQSISTN